MFCVLELAGYLNTLKWGLVEKNFKNLNSWKVWQTIFENSNILLFPLYFPCKISALIRGKTEEQVWERPDSPSQADHEAVYSAPA